MFPLSTSDTHSRPTQNNMASTSVKPTTACDFKYETIDLTGDHPSGDQRDDSEDSDGFIDIDSLIPCVELALNTPTKP